MEDYRSLWKCSEIIKIVPSQGSTTKFILVIKAVKSEVFVLKPLSSLAIQLLAFTVTLLIIVTLFNEHYRFRCKEKRHPAIIITQKLYVLSVLSIPQRGL